MYTHTHTHADLPLCEQSECQQVIPHGSEQRAENAKHLGPSKAEVLSVPHSTPGVKQHPVEEESSWQRQRTRDQLYIEGRSDTDFKSICTMVSSVAQSIYN